MRRWFLSYHSPDLALAERLKAALERKDTDARVFFAPSSLRAGGFWSRALADEIAQADAFILLVGERGVGNWQVLEYDEALDKRIQFPDFPVILVLLEGQTAPGLAFLRRLHWVVTPDPSSEKDVGRLLDAASGSGTTSGEMWRYTSPYRGLAAMEEKDSDYFFGRSRETVDVLTALAAATDRLPVLLGNSGVGKSSLALAGALAALKRQAWPERVDTAPAWPHAFQESRRWCFLTLKPGPEPLKALVGSFFETWQLGAIDPERVKLQNDWIELLRDSKAMLPDLLDATERRYQQLERTKPPAFLLYVDQGEELYVRAEEHQRRRFSEVIARGVADPRLYTLMSMRADFLGELHKDEPLFKVHRKIDVPPLREAELREVVTRPAELLSARFETAGVADIITRRTSEDSVKDVGALPLLSYTLDDMWTQMVKRDDGVLRLPAQSFELGGVLVDRADAFLASHPKSQDELRRIFTLKLATVREGEEPTRRRALRSEFSDEQWRLVSELANDPNRLLVTATPEGGETYAEVAHEAIFRRWGKLRDWIAAEREFLAWKTGLEAARRAWQTAPDRSKPDALLMGLPLAKAQSWFAMRPEDLPEADRGFIALSRKMAQQRRLRAQALVGGLVALVGLLGVGLVYREPIRQFALEKYHWRMVMGPSVLTVEDEKKKAATPGTDSAFAECKKGCPVMIVVPACKLPACKFEMGSPEDEPGKSANEGPQHEVRIAKPFAVSKFEVTFAEWNACVDAGTCQRVSDRWGRGQMPVINVSWDEATQYARWLSRLTGKEYRLLTEAEWEYNAILKAEFRRRIACSHTLALMDMIVDRSNAQETVDLYFNGDDLFALFQRRRGLPIGNLTSQFFANLYLDGFDHFATEVLGAPYVRYVDDFALFHDNPAVLAGWRSRIDHYLAGRRLKLHSRKTKILSCAEPSQFLGLELYADGHRSLPEDNVRRFRNRLRGLRDQWRAGSIERAAVDARIGAWIAHAQHADTWRLRHAIFEGGWFDPANTPEAWTAPCRRVVRGGSWYNNPQNLRAAYRDRSTTDNRNNNLGFRVGRTLSARAGAITVAPGEH